MPKELTVKPKQTRKRIPRTCAQCRKRKQKCDSLKPCAVCKLRGEGDLCDYEGAQPTRVLDEEDESNNPVSAEEIKNLRQQLDDLENAVSAVVNRSSVGPSPPLASEMDNNPWTVDMEEFNLAGTLSNLFICRVITPEIGQEPPIIEKVRRQCRLNQDIFPVSSSHLTASGLSSYFPNQLNLSYHAELQTWLPTYDQARAFLATYVTEYAWFHACFDTRAYAAALPALYTPPVAKDAAQLVAMATSYAIARAAVVKLSPQRAAELNLSPDKKSRVEQSKKWLDLSVVCLKCTDFETSPRLESVSCLIILLETAWFDETVGGMEELSLLFDLKCKAMQLAFDLCLHRDPSHKDPTGATQIDPASARERRMVWWALLGLDGLYSGLTGRMSSIVGLEAVDVFLPALSSMVNPEEVHEGCENGCVTATPATGVKPRLLMGYVGHEISRLPLQRMPLPTISDVNQAHRDLVSLEAHLPETYKLFATGHCTDRSRLPKCSWARRDALHFYMRYHYLFVKLHRPLHLIRREDGERVMSPVLTSTKSTYHRMAVVEHALLLLDLRKIRQFSADYIYGNVMALEASFSLALDYLYDPSSASSSRIKEEVQEYCKFLQASEVALIKRGRKMLECLISSWGTAPPGGAINWFSAAEGPVSPTSWVQGPFHQPPEMTFSGAPVAEEQTQPPTGELAPYSSLRVFQALDPAQAGQHWTGMPALDQRSMQTTFQGVPYRSGQPSFHGEQQFNQFSGPQPRAPRGGYAGEERLVPSNGGSGELMIEELFGAGKGNNTVSHGSGNVGFENHHRGGVAGSGHGVVMENQQHHLHHHHHPHQHHQHQQSLQQQSQQQSQQHQHQQQLQQQHQHHDWQNHR